jgi:signal transduction histidine kinase/DNA-binding NarL/FixJ family response regulator
MLTLATTIGLSTPGLAHEIRNPLSGLVGSLEVMKEITGNILSPENKSVSPETANDLSILNIDLDKIIGELYRFINEVTKTLDAVKIKAQGNPEIIMTMDKEDEDTTDVKRIVATQCKEFCTQAEKLSDKLKTYLVILKKNSEDAEKFLEGINSCVNHLLLLISPLLPSFDQTQELKVEPRHVTAIIEGIRAIYTAQAIQKGLKINFDSTTESNQFLIRDVLPFNQVLINLVTNAIKFTSQGSITINLELKSDTGDLQITVTDTGPGMSEETQTKILSGIQFHQGDSPKSTRAGTGLGLSFAQQLVKQLGGIFTIPKASGEGSSFAFTIAANKLIKEKKALSQDTSRPSSPVKIDEEKAALYPRLRNLKVLIAEDKQDQQNILGRLLAKVGIICQFAENGQQAIDIWNNYEEDNKPNIILMDLCMPEMGDGLIAARRILDKNPHVLIIALSANDSPQDREAAKDAGMKAYLTKPYKQDEICRAITALLTIDHNDGSNQKVNPEPTSTETIVSGLHPKIEAVTSCMLKDLAVFSSNSIQNFSQHRATIMGINTWCGFHAHIKPALPLNTDVCSNTDACSLPKLSLLISLS